MKSEEYEEVGQFQGGDPCGICEAARILSITFPEFTLMAEQIFQTEI